MQMTEDFVRVIHEFSGQSDVSEARQKAFKQCIAIINETFGTNKGMTLTLAEPRAPKALPSGTRLPKPPPGPGN